MDYTLFEINKHKMNICNLSNKLSNTFDINQEILINNEIKKETETIQSLLNIKQNLLSQNNNMNFINPMFNQNNNINNMNNIYLNQQQIMMQQMEQQRIMQEEMERIKREEEKKKNTIAVIFRKGFNSDKEKKFQVLCNCNDKISDIIEKYRIISNDDRVSEEKFIFNAKALNPGLTLSEAGLIENAHIFVVETKGVRG